MPYIPIAKARGFTARMVNPDIQLNVKKIISIK
jgi:hypothetical protein